MTARNTTANKEENTEAPATSHDGRTAEDIVNDTLMGKTGDEREITGVGTFYEDFDNEEYPDAIMPAPGQLVVFDVLSSNIVPIYNKRTKETVDTEVVQVELVEGTTCTVKLRVGDSDEYEDTGDLEPLGEPRSLWINSYMLKKIWEEWDPQPGDRGALKFKGKVEGRNNEYQKWFGRFDKDKPRRVGTR